MSPGISVSKICVPFGGGMDWSSYWTKQALSVLNDGNTIAWYDSQDLTTITKDTGVTEEVSLWKDKLLSGRDLVQGTATKKPIWSSSGIKFDGINDFLTSTFAYNQAATIYIVFRNINFIEGSLIYTGITLFSPFLVNYSSPDQMCLGGDTAYSNKFTLRDGIWGISKGTYNGVGSKCRLNDEDETTGNYGSTNLGGFVLGSNRIGSAQFSNMEVDCVILRSGDEPSASDIIINNFLNIKYNIGNRYNNGKLVITIDDTFVSQYNIIYPILVSEGIKATFYITTDFVDTADHLTWVQLQEMYAAGMDIQCHTKDHVVQTTLTQAQLLAGLQAVNDAFVANGLPIPEHTSYPSGAYNANVALWTSAMRLSARRVNIPLTSNHLIYKDIYKDYFGNSIKTKYQLRSLNVDNLDDAGMVTLKAKLDEVQLKKAACTVYLHGASVGGGALEMPTAHLQELIDYAKSIGMNILSVSELYNISETI